MPFNVYRSSAGSGKTFTLVREYLRIALSTEKPDNYRSILAVTFTNKAAEEMRSRVIRVLTSIAAQNGQEAALSNQLQTALGVTETTMVVRAGSVLKHMLHHYSDVSIGTIDQFSHRLVRTFAQDLGLYTNFNIELETENLERAVLHELMNQVPANAELRTALLDLIESTMEDEKGWNLDKGIIDLIKILFSEESRFHLQKLREIDLREFSELRNKLKPEIKSRQEELKQIGSSALQLLEDNGLTVKHIAGGARGIMSYFQRISKGDFKSASDTVKNKVLKNNWYGSAAKAAEKAAIDGLSPTLTNAFESSDTLLTELKYLRLIYGNIYGVALLDEMQRILSEIQTENEILHISEFNHLISSVVMAETAPFIYERIGARFHHFLVDEFQDTSILQWFNLLPLIDESLAHDNLCLVVGDAKQSIYRWRGGDVRQFVKLPEIYRPPHMQEKLQSEPELTSLFDIREKRLQASMKSEPLNTNFRSSQTVVNFNNQLFDWLRDSMPAEHQAMYKDCTQLANNKSEGLVKIEALRQENSSLSWPEYELLAHEQIVGWIEECKEDGYSYGDMAILFSTNKLAVETAQYLISKGYDVVSSESLLINSSVKVRLLINLAIYISDPQNSVNTAELVRHFNECMSDREKVSKQLMACSGGKNPAAIKEQIASSSIHIDWQRISTESPYSVFSMLAHSLFEDASDPRLDFFLNEVLSFTNANRRSLSDFLEHWLEKRDKLSVALEKNDEAISIMTVHKSKGLEFPVVIHPFANYPKRSGKNHIWVYLEDDKLKPLDRLRLKSSSSMEGTPMEHFHRMEDELEAMDMFNQLYVALTRAKDRLYVSGKLKMNGHGQKGPSNAIEHIMDYLASNNRLQAGDDKFVVGERRKIELSKDVSQKLSLQKTGDPFWSERLALATPRSISERSGSEARLRGIAIHEALSRIITDKDVDRAVQHLVESGQVSQSETAEISLHISKLMSKAELKPLFASDQGVRNEADIQLESGRWLRPDRIVTKGSEAWVLDYKTGEEKQEHVGQIKDYMNALGQLGYDQVTGMLVYIETEKIICA